MPGSLRSAAGRFADDLGRLIGDIAAVRLGIAVSGGPDSVALLLLANAVCPGRVAAATVDHGLRRESAIEAVLVERLAAGLGVPHATLVPETPITGSVQARARAARYALLEAWRRRAGLDWVLTAHHADDQAETLLMRLNRGAGVGGLAGIRPVNGRVVRPVLRWRRLELAAIVADAGIEPVEDPSNADHRYDRARVRTALGRADWLDPAAIAASATHLADAHAALDWAAARLAVDRLRDDGDGGLVLDPRDLPDELVRRLLSTAIDRLDSGRDPSGPELDRVLVAMRGGGKVSIGRLIAVGGASWRLVNAPPRRSK